MKNEKKLASIVTILYSIIVIPIICLLFLRIIESVLFVFIDIFSLFSALFYLFIIFLFVLPYIFLLLNMKKKNNNLIKGTIIYEVAIVILFTLLIWIVWPVIKQSITGCWQCVTDNEGKTVCGVCH